MLKISKLADYSMVLMGCLSDSKDTLFSASQLAELSSIPLPTVSKVLKLLSGSNLVIATRGVHGGYRLVASPSKTSVAQVIAAIDGGLALTECSDPVGKCTLAEHCRLRSNWQYINHQIANLLSKISITDMENRMDCGVSRGE